VAGLTALVILLYLVNVIMLGSNPVGAVGNPPDVECASTDPAWNGVFYKVQVNDGVLTSETEGSGLIGITGTQGVVTWVNNEPEDYVFRYVLKVGTGTGNTDTVVNALWAPGEGGTIDLDEVGLSHMTFCFTEPEATTTTTTEATTTTTTEATTTTTTEATTTTTTEATTTTTQATTTTEATTTTAPAEAVPTILGTVVTAAPTVAVDTLPFTGLEAQNIIILALGILATGVLVLSKVGRAEPAESQPRHWSQRDGR
jgi:hypothetical protein